MHPILCKIGPLPVHAYGFMLMLGFIAGILWTMREAKRRRTNSEVILDFALYALVSAVIFSRLVFVLLDLPYYSAHPVRILQTWNGGLSFHGGLGGAILALILFCRFRRLDFWLMTDILTPGVPLGYALARLGCFLNGCCYGTPTDLPWGLRFPDPSLPGQLTPPSHPTQIYSSLLSLLVFMILVKVRFRFKVKGQLLFAYLFLYSLTRFLLEYLRWDVTAKVMGGWITQAQLASLILMILSIGILLTLSKRTPKNGTR